MALKVHCIRQDVGTIVVRIEGGTVTTPLAEILVSFLRQAVSGGVRLILEYTPISDWFTWDVSSWDTSAGWGDAKT